MRLSILIILLLSFSVLAEPDTSDLRDPEVIMMTTVKVTGLPFKAGKSNVWTEKGDFMAACNRVMAEFFDAVDLDKASGNTVTGYAFHSWGNTGAPCPGRLISMYIEPPAGPGWRTLVNGSISLVKQEESESCPPSYSPEHFLPYHGNGRLQCAKPLNHCPAPTDQDYLIPGIQQGVRTICYDNPDGTQCKIETDETGAHYQPYDYGSQEPVECRDSTTPDPDPEPDPEPEPTNPPDEVPDPEPPTDTDNSQGDDSDKSTDIEALNQINDNLTIINESINTASDENSERLNLIKDNIDNTNTFLDQQNGVLSDIRDELKKEDSVTATANRKTGGLNDFFTDEDKAKLVIELENKKQQLTDVYTQIQNDVTDRFNFSNSISGTYESRTIEWHGHKKEVGAQRLSENLFKQLAPIVLLVCSIIALGILLWE